MNIYARHEVFAKNYNSNTFKDDSLDAWYLRHISKHYLTSFAALGVFSFLLAQIGRDNGKKKEKELFKHWGGKPTNTILKHSNDHLDVHTKKRFHTKLEQIISDIKIPTAEEEQKNPQTADAIYDNCTKYLIAKTRDSSKYFLLFKENINYGFRRNLWGMKTWALLIILISTSIHLFITTKKFTTIEPVNIKDWGLLGDLCFLPYFGYLS
jgi:hypothetical protein